MLLVIIDLTVADDTNRPVLIEERLMAIAESHDAEPHVTESNGALIQQCEACIIGATMGNGRTHSAQIMDGNGCAAKIQNGGNTTHVAEVHLAQRDFVGSLFQVLFVVLRNPSTTLVKRTCSKRLRQRAT